MLKLQKMRIALNLLSYAELIVWSPRFVPFSQF
jgi:hypothetical protein